MKQYTGLLRNIALELNISRGSTESEDSWKARVIYSVLGRMAYAALWDVTEDLQPVSIAHVKKRIHKLLLSYVTLYPEIKSQFDLDQELEDEILNVLLTAGYARHSPYRLYPTSKCAAKVEDILFVRGQMPDENIFMSGIGAYQKAETYALPLLDVRTMFQFQRMNMKQRWEATVSNAVWTKVVFEQNIEYLRTTPPFRTGYWSNLPTKNMVSICRTGERGNYLYYLYRYNGTDLRVSQLPTWATKEAKYRELANGHLLACGTLPGICYRSDGKITYIRFEYLPAPSELNIIRLYSWPNSYRGLPHDFNRVMSSDIFQALKPVLEETGYLFVEE